MGQSVGARERFLGGSLFQKGHMPSHELYLPSPGFPFPYPSLFFEGSGDDVAYRRLRQEPPVLTLVLLAVGVLLPVGLGAQKAMCGLDCCVCRTRLTAGAQ